MGKRESKKWHVITSIMLLWLILFIYSGIADRSYAAVQQNAKGSSVVKNLGNGSDGRGWENPHHLGVRQYKYTIRTNGTDIAGYCFQSGKNFGRGKSYTAKTPSNASAWTNLSADRQRIIRLALFYGYNDGKSAPYGNVNDYYAATQVLIWEAADGDIALSADGKWSSHANKHHDLIYGRTAAVNNYNWIKAQITRHVTGPSFAGRNSSSAVSHKMQYSYDTGKWTLSLTDKNKGNMYNRHSNTDASLKQTRNSYVYDYSVSFAGIRKLELVNAVSGGTDQGMMVFKPTDSGYQAIMFGAEDTTKFYASLMAEEKGTGIIKKQNSDGSDPEGFRFLVQNRSNGYSMIHTTDDRGQIILNVYPGTYEFTEMLTEEQKAQGFMTPAAGKINVTSGKTSTAITENKRTGTPYEIIKTSDSGEVEGFKFHITDSQGEIAATGVTDKNGIIEGELYPGTYIVHEELTTDQMLDGYEAARPQAVNVAAGESIAKVLEFHNKYEAKRGRIKILKITGDGGPAEGFRFDITGIGRETGETYELKNLMTDENGKIETEKLPWGTYIITEVLTNKQKERYIQPKSQTLEFSEDSTDTAVFRNEHVTTDVELVKTSTDGKAGGIQFTISGEYAWGDEFSQIKRKTDEDGRIELKLQPGTYTFTETDACAANYMEQEPKTVTITGKEDGKVRIRIENRARTIELTKTEVLEDGTDTTGPVEGAVYEVCIEEEAGGKRVRRLVGEYTTDKNGKLKIQAIPPGKYFLREVEVPYGYQSEKKEISVTVNQHTEITEISDTNQRKYGTLLVTKLNEEKYVVPDAVFGLYADSGCSILLGNYRTDDSGRFKAEELEWGTYYLKELEAPRGFIKDEEVKKIIIGKTGDIDAECTIINKQKKGSVELTKKDAASGTKLEGAVFSLYINDGTLVSEGHITDKNGQIKVDDLAWNDYYFQETAAPDGYDIDASPVRFSVNATTAGITQHITAENQAEMSNIVITKKLKASDIHYDHGVPVFTFNLKGKTVSGEEKEYNRQVTFSEEYVRSNTDDEGYVSASAVFHELKAGTYTCSEKEIMRYELAGISKVSAGGKVSADGKSVTFTLADHGQGEATFTNEKTDWADYSDTRSMTNILKTGKKLTAIIVEYTGPDILEGNLIFDSQENLEVTAFYDDGTERAIANGEYQLTNADGTEFIKTENQKGSYRINVSYTESGITRTGSFAFQVEPVQQVTVKFQTNGGAAMSDLTVWKNDTLNDYSIRNTVPVKNKYMFAGWHKDSNMTEDFFFTDPIREDMTLYADWVPMNGYVIYSADDGSLVFTRSLENIKAGGTYNGKKVTAVYTDVEYEEYLEPEDVPWYKYRSDIKIVEVEELFIPCSTANWFRDFENCRSWDLVKLDMSGVYDARSMFQGAGKNTSPVTVTGMENWYTSWLIYVEGMLADFPLEFDDSVWDLSAAEDLEKIRTAR